MITSKTSLLCICCPSFTSTGMFAARACGNAAQAAASRGTPIGTGVQGPLRAPRVLAPISKTIGFRDQTLVAVECAGNKDRAPRALLAGVRTRQSATHGHNVKMFETPVACKHLFVSGLTGNAPADSVGAVTCGAAAANSSSAYASIAPMAVLTLSLSNRFSTSNMCALGEGCEGWHTAAGSGGELGGGQGMWAGVSGVLDVVAGSSARAWRCCRFFSCLSNSKVSLQVMLLSTRKLRPTHS